MPAVFSLPKFVSSLAVAAMIAVSLVACSTGAPADNACEVTPSGSRSESVKISGDFGKEPKVTMPASFEVKKTERTVLINGKGDEAVEGRTVTANYGVYNAQTGKQVELDPGATWIETQFDLSPALNSTFPGLFKTLECARAGDRIVSAVPAGELFGLSGTDMSSVGIGATDTLVFIMDVSKVEMTPTPTPTAEPTPEPLSLPTPSPWVDNVPSVDLSGDVPVVTLPKTAPPTELQLKVITEGTGAVVEAMSNVSVTVDYQGISWNKGSIFDQSFTRDAPSTFGVGQVVKGFGAALVGQKVGSVVLVSIPPALAYGEGEINDQNLIGQTLVFLIEIHDVAVK
ncbi:MAG: FKBP-type peptidyl-prolyl cis-trans isomerase [Terrimesophilobacter sp.]